MDIETLRQIAIEHHRGLRQYDGVFDDYVMVRMNKRITTKLGLAFEADELAIADPDTTQAYRTVYSIRNRVRTAVPHSAVSSIQ